MRIELPQTQPEQRGSVLIAYLLLLLLTVSALAALGAFVAQNTSLTHRRNDMVEAIQFAQGGAVVSCNDLNTAVTTKAGTVTGNLVTLGYVLNTSLSTSQEKAYLRTITTPFTNQTVTAQVWLPNVTAPRTARIVAIATKGKVTQTATVNVQVATAYPAAIISTHPGTTSKQVSKSVAFDGNVVVNGWVQGRTIVDGGTGLAILANGQVNLDWFASVPSGSISKTNYNTSNEIPDFTAQGTTNALFDFARFVAVANLTTNALNPRGNNHFTNMTTFRIANNRAFTNAAKALEGVIVVDVLKNTADMTVSLFPNGINVKGTLFFKFDSTYGPQDKLINEAAINVNPANLSGLVATDPATYPSGYPPVYYDNSKNPTNIDISSKGFLNFRPGEDLPALLYSIGILDIHGEANISGVMYTPSSMEIENKEDHNLQYFKGCLIMGLGIYYENVSRSTSIITYDARTVDALVTSASGKQIGVTYWQ